jgi:hypothetical protein
VRFYSSSTVQGSRHTWTLQKKHSFKHSFFPAIQLFPLCVGCLVGCCVGCCVVVMLLSLSLFTLLPHCQHRRCHHRWHAAATIGMPPPPPLPSDGKEDDACYTNADSSPATSAQAVCRALESRALLDRPLPAGRACGKGGDDDGGTDDGGQSRIAHRISMVLPSPTQGGATAMRVADK